MYRVVYADNPQMKKPIIVHDIGQMNKASSGKIELTLNGLGISSFTFSINPKNTLYRKIKPLSNYIDVYDVHDENKPVKIFSGRVLRIGNKMSANGEFQEEVVCEDRKAFLHDSVQSYMKPTLMGVSEYLKKLLDVHNGQVEPHKMIYLGWVTVKDDEPIYRGIGYESTADTIREKLLDRLGGYLILKEDAGRYFLDYLKDYGETSKTPLQITRNLRSATRDIDISELGTRIVPLGADLEQDETTEEIGSDFSRPKVNISSVNDGKIYLEDSALVREFGIITKTVNFPDTKSPGILRTKGLGYISNQRLMLVTWTIEALEVGLIDPRYEVIRLGNYYPVMNQFLYEKETLQVIEKKINILQPQRIELTIGSGKKTLSQYQLESKAMESTLQTIYSNLQKSNANLLALQKEAEELRNQTNLIPEQAERLKELEKIIEDLTNELNGLKDPDYLSGKITTISDDLGEINWEKAKEDSLILAIIRVQKGSDLEDDSYLQNIQECDRLGIRYAVYAECEFGDADEEAQAFYDRVQEANAKPVFYCSYFTSTNEESYDWSIQFADKLNQLGIHDNKQILFHKEENYGASAYDYSRYGGVWISNYSAVSPTPTHDLWNYTSSGSVKGVAGYVQLSKYPSKKFKENYLRK